MKKKSALLDPNMVRIIIIILGSVFSTLILAFAVLALINIHNNDTDTASWYLLGIFIVLGLSRLVTWIKERTRVTLLRLIILLIVDIALGILIFFGKNSPYLYSLSAGLFCITIILSRILILIQNHSIRSIIYNAIIIAIAALLAIGLFVPVTEDAVYSPVVVVCIIIVVSALGEVLSNAMSTLKLKVLFQIVFRTYALEVILGLITMIIVSSLVFLCYEETITNFADALWYSFAVVTTIGFGDFVAQTILGRIVTVLLGIYGIIVVAVITSIIVNFYNETVGKHDSKQIKDIKEENKK